MVGNHCRWDKKGLGLELKVFVKLAKQIVLYRQQRILTITTSVGHLTNFDGRPQSQSKTCAEPIPWMAPSLPQMYIQNKNEYEISVRNFSEILPFSPYDVYFDLIVLGKKWGLSSVNHLGAEQHLLNLVLLCIIYL